MENFNTTKDTALQSLIETMEKIYTQEEQAAQIGAILRFTISHI